MQHDVLRNTNVLLFTVTSLYLLAHGLLGLNLNPVQPIKGTASTPNLASVPTLETVVPTQPHQTCDGTNMVCPSGQYCFIQGVIGLPKGICLRPGEAQP